MYKIKKPETSVILPVYNVEKYIDQCIESLLKQTYKDFEMIFVIDGSSDSSESIIRKWSTKDSRIKVIVQENSGSGPARNNGLKNAQGTYIVFVDPDDWVEPNMFEYLISKMKKYDVDMITSGCINDYYDGEQLVSSVSDHFDRHLLTDIDEVHKAYVPLYLAGALGAPTKKIYKKFIIDSENIEFPPLRRSQDIVFNYRYYEHIRSILVDDASLYHYRIEQNTYFRKLHQKYYQAISMIYGDINQLLDSWNITLDEETNLKFHRHLFNLIVWQISIGQSAKEMKNLVNDKNIRKLTKEVIPQNIKQKILRELILLRMDGVINFAVGVNGRIKNEFH